MNTGVDNLITTNLVNIKTLSAKLIKLSIMFTGKVSISLLSYVHLKSFINGNADPVEKTFHMQSYTMHSASSIFFSISHWICTFPIYTTTNVQSTSLSCPLHHEFLFTHTVVSPERCSSPRGRHKVSLKSCF